MRYWLSAFMISGCLSAVMPAAYGVELHFESLSAGELSATAAGPQSGPLVISAPLSAGLDSSRARSGISTINDIKTAGSLGQAATSIAVHAILRMAPNRF
jgi:hypothetical protein